MAIMDELMRSIFPPTGMRTPKAPDTIEGKTYDNGGRFMSYSEMDDPRANLKRIQNEIAAREKNPEAYKGNVASMEWLKGQEAEYQRAADALAADEAQKMADEDLVRREREARIGAMNRSGRQDKQSGPKTYDDWVSYYTRVILQTKQGSYMSGPQVDAMARSMADRQMGVNQPAPMPTIEQTPFSVDHLFTDQPAPAAATAPQPAMAPTPEPAAPKTGGSSYGLSSNAPIINQLMNFIRINKPRPGSSMDRTYNPQKG